MQLIVVDQTLRARMIRSRVANSKPGCQLFEVHGLDKNTGVRTSNNTIAES
jgi:hypothetical protein